MKRSAKPIPQPALALVHIGKSVDDQLRWLTDFQARDLDVPAVLEQTQADVRLFEMASMLRRHLGTAKTDSIASFPSSKEGTLDSKVLSRLQLHVRECLKTMRELGHLYEFPADLSVFRGLARQRDGIVLVAMGTHEERFLAEVSLLLVDARDLRFCAEAKHCGRPFIARRAWQSYCSEKCTNRAAQYRYRKRRADDLADRAHASYRRRKGKTRVKRHPRSRRPAPGELLSAPPATAATKPAMRYKSMTPKTTRRRMWYRPRRRDRQVVTLLSRVFCFAER